MTEDFDVLIIGGGINGCGIARDAAGRGLKVLLCEQDDIASHTSSSSTKLIHGGLRYLENYEFSMVRDALSEREVLMRIAPHLVWPLRFVLPHAQHLRPAWMIRIGLFLYDYLGKRDKLPTSGQINLRKDVAGRGLRKQSNKAFTYSDCATMDSRLTVINAVDACERGATIQTRTRCESLTRCDNHWQVSLSSNSGKSQINARLIVNASGPWVSDVIENVASAKSPYRIRLVQGSHIIVAKMFEHENGYIFQNSDNRIVFAIPYENDFTLIGTTDLEYDGDPAECAITESETRYLCDLINSYFEQQISPDDVISSYSGVRPLFEDESSNASKVSREYVLSLNKGESGEEPPILNIFGGKLTAYRQLAEKALKIISTEIGCNDKIWTNKVPLPGGDIENEDFEKFLWSLEQQYGWLPKALRKRYARQYGTRIHTLLQDYSSVEELGVYFGADLYECEVRYLMDFEWAIYPDDILYRRTRQGLMAEHSTRTSLENFMSNSSRSSFVYPEEQHRDERQA